MKKIFAFVFVVAQLTLVVLKMAGIMDEPWHYVFAPTLLAVGVSLHLFTAAIIAMSAVKRAADQGIFTKPLEEIAGKVQSYSAVNTEFASTVNKALSALDKRIAELEKQGSIH